MYIDILETLTRCEEEDIGEVNVHGYNKQFYISSMSNQGFIVQQEKDVFRLLIP